MGDQEILRNAKIKSTFDFLQSVKYKSHIESSKFGYSYNPPGWENQVVLRFLKSNTNIWLDWETKNSFNSNEGVYNNVQYDPWTYLVRTYELVYCFR